MTLQESVRSIKREECCLFSASIEENVDIRSKILEIEMEKRLNKPFSRSFSGFAGVFYPSMGGGGKQFDFRGGMGVKYGRES
ncbi:MAG: hypothetical protein QW794_09010 [Thermosphaera sp.]